MARNKIQPIYLFAGGPGSNRAITHSLLKTIFRTLAGRTPIVGYVGAANDDDPEFFRWGSAMLKEAGAKDVILAPLADPVADAADARAVLKQADVIFFSGGDVDAGMRTLEERKMLLPLKQLLRDGKTFIGSSAGSIMLAAKWIRWPDRSEEESTELFPCAGLAKVLCDTHAEKDGWDELWELLELIAESAIGYGISTNTALKVFPGGRVKALGGPIFRFKKDGDEISRIEDLMP